MLSMRSKARLVPKTRIGYRNRLLYDWLMSAQLDAVLVPLSLSRSKRCCHRPAAIVLGMGTIQRQASMTKTLNRRFEGPR